MAKEKLEDLSLDKLRKRKNIAVVLLWVLIVTAILNIVILFRVFIGVFEFYRYEKTFIKS